MDGETQAVFRLFTLKLEAMDLRDLFGGTLFPILLVVGVEDDSDRARFIWLELALL